MVPKGPTPGHKNQPSPSHAFHRPVRVGLVFSIAKWNATPICLKQLSVNQHEVPYMIAPLGPLNP